MAYLSARTAYDGTTYPVASGDLIWVNDVSATYDRPCPVSIFTAYIKTQFAPTSQSIAFTDGDTFRRVTITDAAVSATSKIMLTVTRPTTTDENDVGWIYIANVISRGTGTFDVIISALDYGLSEAEIGPNETITLNYQVF
jgi:hypothetical protein